MFQWDYTQDRVYLVLNLKTVQLKNILGTNFRITFKPLQWILQAVTMNNVHFNLKAQYNAF